MPFPPKIPVLYDNLPPFEVGSQKTVLDFSQIHRKYISKTKKPEKEMHFL
jgi:hypothetical protein